jgi:hypothetical protein
MSSGLLGEKTLSARGTFKPLVIILQQVVYDAGGVKSLFSV